VHYHRKPRILWANFHSLVDPSSGASLSVREMLRQLAFNGYEVFVIGASVFDSERAATVLPENWRQQLATTDILDLDDPPLKHQLLMTASHVRDLMTPYEESRKAGEVYRDISASTRRLIHVFELLLCRIVQTT
jgi:hypothetical protein